MEGKATGMKNKRNEQKMEGNAKVMKSNEEEIPNVKETQKGRKPKGMTTNRD